MNFVTAFQYSSPLVAQREDRNFSVQPNSIGNFSTRGSSDAVQFILSGNEHYITQVKSSTDDLFDELPETMKAKSERNPHLLALQ